MKRWTKVSMLVSMFASILLIAGCGAMQSMMTASVDDTAKAKVLGVAGEHEAHRLGADGNSAPLEIVAESNLITADLVVGSDDETSAILVALDDDNFARFNAADFVLRSPIGDDNKVFVLVLEYGAVELNVVDGSGRSFQIQDTNKNDFFVEDASARFVVLADDDGTRVFVKEGAVRASNSRTESTETLDAGSGIMVDFEGVSTPLTADDEWIASYQWAADPSVPLVAPEATPAPEAAPTAEATPVDATPANAPGPGAEGAKAPTQAVQGKAAPAATTGDEALPEK